MKGFILLTLLTFLCHLVVQITNLCSKLRSARVNKTITTVIRLQYLSNAWFVHCYVIVTKAWFKRSHISWEVAKPAGVSSNTIQLAYWLFHPLALHKNQAYTYLILKPKKSLLVAGRFREEITLQRKNFTIVHTNRHICQQIITMN